MAVNGRDLCFRWFLHQWAGAAFDGGMIAYDNALATFSKPLQVHHVSCRLGSRGLLMPLFAGQGGLDGVAHHSASHRDDQVAEQNPATLTFNHRDTQGTRKCGHPDEK